MKYIRQFECRISNCSSSNMMNIQTFSIAHCHIFFIGTRGHIVQEGYHMIYSSAISNPNLIVSIRRLGSHCSQRRRWSFPFKWIIGAMEAIQGTMPLLTTYLTLNYRRSRPRLRSMTILAIGYCVAFLLQIWHSGTILDLWAEPKAPPQKPFIGRKEP